ncbi:HNH endonuclease [Halococcus saccharolyticus]|uniref:HNH endonuclease n=1 Tax=Halococcus saccharolyticus DSM 5350 TaxID=1227455 RepID=M0MQD4_9EURY|nr:HNH endonuclease [Halococcus saccharolyticus]EMA47937.1 HNH endonuclease [Halococcus saccharolyticus DSM 5350]
MNTEEILNDPDKLREMYWEDDLSYKGIAGEIGSTVYYVKKAFDRFDLERKSSGRAKEVPWDGEDELRELYVEEGLSTIKISQEFGCSRGYVCTQLEKAGIERRPSRSGYGYAPYKINSNGYPVWKTYVDGTHHRVPVHRLLAVAEFGFEEVAGNDVHHKNGRRFDNRPGNISVLDPSEHRRKHGLENADEQRELMEELREAGKLGGGSA